MNANVKDMKIGLLVPCCVDQFAPQTGERVVQLLAKMGCEAVVPAEATCCGRTLYYGGDREGARQLGERLMSQYGDYSHVVVAGSGCVAYLKREFGQLFRNTTYHNDFRAFTDRCYDLSDFLANVADWHAGEVVFPHRVAVLDHCMTMRDYVSLAHPDRQGLHDEPRQLLRSLADIELVEMEQGEVCCGGGGQFVNLFTPVSDDLAKRKADAAAKASVEYVVSTEPSCLLHLQSYLDKYNKALKCRYIADVLCGCED